MMQPGRDGFASLFGAVFGPGQLSSEVKRTMNAFALTRAKAAGKNIWVCVIDGQDTARLVQAYLNHF